MAIFGFAAAKAAAAVSGPAAPVTAAVNHWGRLKRG